MFMLSIPWRQNWAVEEEGTPEMSYLIYPTTYSSTVFHYYTTTDLGLLSILLLSK